MENKKNNRNILVGAIIAIIGGLLLLNNFGLIGFPLTHYLISWKTLLIVIGLFMMASGKHLTGGIIVASLGVIFWLPSIFSHQIVLGQIFLPAMLVVLGVILLLKAGGLKNKDSFTKYEEIESTELSGNESK